MGGLWDGDPEKAKEPAAYFVFICQTCDELLLYHYQADEFNFEDLFPCRQNNVECMTWDETELTQNLKLMWPQQPLEHIHHYVPEVVRKRYLKALKNLGSAQIL